MEYPKYTLSYDKRDVYAPFTVREQITTEGGGLMSRPYRSFKRFEDALEELSDLSTGPVLIAVSAQAADGFSRI